MSDSHGTKKLIINLTHMTKKQTFELGDLQCDNYSKKLFFWCNLTDANNVTAHQRTNNLCSSAVRCFRFLLKFMVTMIYLSIFVAKLVERSIKIQFECAPRRPFHGDNVRSLFCFPSHYSIMKICKIRRAPLQFV